MSPRNARTRLVAFLVGGCVAFLGPSAAERASSSPATPQSEGPADVYAVGAGELSVRVIFLHGVCGPIRTRATEADVSVRIEVVEERMPDAICPAIAIVGRVTVPLARPLAGRALVGYHSSGSSRYLIRRGGVPRLLGFSPLDAGHALGLAGLHMRARRVPARGGLPRIVAQYPPPGRPIPTSEVIRVAIAGN
jgi:hypothetical protein